MGASKRPPLTEADHQRGYEILMKMDAELHGKPAPVSFKQFSTLKKTNKAKPNGGK